MVSFTFFFSYLLTLFIFASLSQFANLVSLVQSHHSQNDHLDFMFLPIMFLRNCNFFYNNIPKGALSLDFTFLLPICKHNCWGTRKLYFYFYYLFFNFDSIIFFHFLFLFKLTLIQTLLNLLTKATT